MNHPISLANYYWTYDFIDISFTTIAMDDDFDITISFIVKFMLMIFDDFK